MRRSPMAWPLRSQANFCCARNADIAWSPPDGAVSPRTGAAGLLSLTPFLCRPAPRHPLPNPWPEQSTPLLGLAARQAWPRRRCFPGGAPPYWHGAPSPEGGRWTKFVQPPEYLVGVPGYLGGAPRYLAGARG